MNNQIDIQNLISTSTKETFKNNLKEIVEKNVPIGERLTLYNYIATDVYSQGYRNYGIDSWELGLEYLDVEEIDHILKADLLKTYGLAWMELSQFDLAEEYLHKSLEYLNGGDNGILIDIYFGLSIVYKYLVDIPKAIEYSKKATQIAKKINDDFEISRAYLNSANLFVKINKNSKAKKYYCLALKYANLDEVRSNIYMNLGLLYKNSFEYKEAEKMYKKAEKIFFELEMVNEIFELYINYGTLYSKLARFDEAEEYLTKSLEYFEQIEDSYNSVVCYLNLGRVEQDRANFYKALEYFNYAIELSNQDTNLVSMVSLLYYSRANIFYSLKEYSKAVKDYEIAQNYAIKQSDRAMEASIKNALAGIEADNGNIEKAEALYQEIIEVFEEDNNIEEIVATYTNIALLYDKKGMYQLAQKAHEKALKLARDVKIVVLEISILINLAELYATVVAIEKAINLYNEALELLSYYDNDDLLSKCYLNLANIYESTTEFKRAIKYGKLALGLKEKLEQSNALYIVYNTLAISYDGLKQIEEAEKYYKKALNEAREKSVSNYYGILVNYGLFLFNLKGNKKEALRCYDEAKEYFEKEQKFETLIAINSNYAMLYQAQSKSKEAIQHYKKSLEYAEFFLSFIEDENMMMKYRINFEHIYENLIELYLIEENYVEAFYYLESLKSRTFSKMLSSSYFESKLIPNKLLEEERALKEQLAILLNRDSNVITLNDRFKELHTSIKKIYFKMREFDERYVLLKENVPLGSDRIRRLL